MSDIRKWDEVNGVDEDPGHLTAFLESATDSYAILQLRHTDDTLYERFESYSSLQRQSKEPDIDHYEVVYHGDLPKAPDTPEAVMAQLEALYVQFNTAHPDDFRGHSLSVSDIVICSPYGRQGNKERQEGNGETCRSRGSRTTAADKRMSSEADAHTGSSATRWSTSINNREMDQPLRSRGGSRASR